MTYKFNPKIFFLFVGAYLLCLGYLAVYLLIPAGDEVYFATIVYSTLTKGILVASGDTLFNAHHEVSKQEILTYGNIYFVLTAYFCKIFGGFSMENYRICGFLTAIVSLLLSCFCLSHKKFLSNTYIYFFVLLYIFDIAFIQGVMQFRMEQMALCFVLISTFLCLYAAPINMANSKVAIFYPLLSGFSAACGLLTTPRVAILLVGIGLVYLIRATNNKNKIAELAFFVLGVAIIYGAWIFIKFGNLGNFIEYYTNSNVPFVYMKNKTDLISIFLFENTVFSVNLFQYPALIAVMVAVILQIKDFKKAFIQDELMFISLTNIFLYYLLIHKQLYIFFILPFVFIIILKTLQNKATTVNPPYIRYALVSYLVFSFLSVFAYRAIKIYTFADNKNYQSLSQQVISAIPKNSKVIGSETYYYVVTCNESNFQYINIMIPPIRGKNSVDLPLTIKKMIEIHKTTFKPQYFIIETENDKRKRDKIIQDAYFKEFNLVPYKEIVVAKDENAIQKSLKALYKKFGLATPTNYNGMIYKVIGAKQL
jgi:archaellin